jgi:hypothetical protein
MSAWGSTVCGRRALPSCRVTGNNGQWVRRFILFHHKRHPKVMGVEEINQFLLDLAVTQLWRSMV